MRYDEESSSLFDDGNWWIKYWKYYYKEKPE